MAAAKADIKYGFWVGMGVLLAVALWGFLSMFVGGHSRKMTAAYGS
jgi:hypothetical protein